MITTREFARRRKRLLEIVGSGGIAIQTTAPERLRNGDVHFPFRADSDFHYLTGFPEPEAVAVFVPHRPQGEFLLFCRERDAAAETWHGRRAGLEGARERYGADDAFPIGDLDEIVTGLIEDKERIFYTMGRYADWDRRVLGWISEVGARKRTGVHTPEEIISLAHHLHELRLFKAKAELRAMRHAAAVTVAAHQRAMRACRPGLFEYQLEAELLHAYHAAGCRAPAYPAIVGGGANGCILHYVDNDMPLADGDLVLIDSGAEFECYAADITRTFPVNGRFSAAQREVYEVVLEAQHAAIAAAKPGNHWNDPHEAAVRVLTKGLLALGILKGRLPALLKQEAYKPYYMHRTGHWLGLDVHDVGDYKIGGEWRALEPGMVLTIEPGLYLAAGSKGLARRWWDIGVRIEDNVLITPSDNEVLTGALAKSVADIEALMADRPAG
ncbi:MAG: Xaa-Pro aminopeptidase [Gammaproteobacteria bacterium]|nr:Xaa-Pro aminopeptidase [Gammaproteobacteria bacterium]